MLSQILTTISSCKSLSSEIQIEPELFYTSNILLPEIKNRLLKLCKMEKAEIKDIIFSVFGTTTFEGKKYVKQQSSFSYFSVNHLLVSKKASQIEVKMGKKGVTTKNELQMYFQNKEVTNTFLQEILNSIKNGGSVFTGELRDGLEKVFDLKFYEAINGVGDGNAIKDAVINGTGLKELFKELISKEINDSSCFINVKTNDRSKGDYIKYYVVEILNELIDSGELMILELFEIQNSSLKFKKEEKDTINEKIRNKLLLKFPYRAYDRIIWDTFHEYTGHNKKRYIFEMDCYLKELTFFGDIIKHCDFKGDFTVFFLQMKEITEFAEEFHRLYEYVRICENIESPKQNIEEYENILKSLKKDTETTILIENHINHIKALIKHSSEQKRIFNILNDESIAFNFKIVFKDSNEKIQSVVSKYYTIKEEELHVIEEFIQTPTPTSKPTPPPDEPVKIKYTGILTKPWFYICLLVALVVVRVILMYFMSQGRYAFYKAS